MDKYAPKFSKVLLTPDPHYIPGYAGYCPQLKFNMGKGYGKLTAELLTSPEVKHSKQLVLHTGFPATDSDTSVKSIPDSNLRMIPGYTGFIPKCKNYFSCSYSDTCLKALAEFDHEKQTRLQHQSTDLPVIASYWTQRTERQKLPLRSTSDTVITYKSTTPFNPVGKPLNMDDDNPQKYYMSGYTGHVPKSHFLIGKGYPITTNQALIQFGKQQHLVSKDEPGSESSMTPPMPAICQPKRGVVPSFTGHIPGYRFMYGHSFGQLCQNALEKSSKSLTCHTAQ
uniref:Ciliary microtubule inner protein 2B n=1 Tax=Amphilophus citrinellus TaxID=61819 RepID=A0A3Q0SNP3_AMPCI